MAQQKMGAQRAREHVIHFEVDSEPLETTERELTPNAILGMVRLDVTTHYLVQVEGRHQISYQGKGGDPIHMHEGMKFVSLSTEPTPVS